MCVAWIVQTKDEHQLNNFNRFRQSLDAASSSSPDNPDFGIQMLEKLSSQQESAYENLYNWVQGYLSLNPPTSSEAALSDEELEGAYSDEFVPHAIEALERRPAFAEHVRDLVCATRRQALTHKFLKALSGNYDGAGGGWIKLRAHDPVSYIGDILAWIHRAVAVEGEVLTFVFGRLNAASLKLSEILSRVISGVARPFKSRTLSIIESLVFNNDDVLEGDENASRYKLVSLYGIVGVLQVRRVFFLFVAVSSCFASFTNPDRPTQSSTTTSSRRRPSAALASAPSKVLT